MDIRAQLNSTAHEKHYSVQELVPLWRLSRPKLTELFRDEPGVIKIGYGYRRGREGRITLRIPASIAERVHSKLSESSGS